MNNTSAVYIEIPHNQQRPECINTLLEKRMKEFLLMRRQKIWQREGK